ncbi:MAG TPA: MAPEG family protein [Gammaproteobacteria bacterium]|nr:MAPEG family protein [Gammaproteobacteria bacterium]
MHTSGTAILLPMVCLIGLTFFTLWLMFFTRVNYMRSNRVGPQRLQDRNAAREVLAAVAAPSDHFNNLLELPLLFYFAVILIWLMKLTDISYLVMAWLFFGLRLAHSVIHLSYNRVMHRFMAFCAGAVVLTLIWIRLGWQILSL